MIAPKHQDELAFYIAANSRIEIFERDYLLSRLANQNSIQKFTGKVQRQILRNVRLKNKGVKEPLYQEIYDHIEKICWNLYVFISRSQVENLPKLGILGEWLA